MKYIVYYIKTTEVTLTNSNYVVILKLNPPAEYYQRFRSMRKKLTMKYLDILFSWAEANQLLFVVQNYCGINLNDIVKNLKKTKKLSAMKNIIQESQEFFGKVKYLYTV